LPQKRESLLDLVSSFKDILLEKGGLFEVGARPKNAQPEVVEEEQEEKKESPLKSFGTQETLSS